MWMENKNKSLLSYVAVIIISKTKQKLSFLLLHNVVWYYLQVNN